MRSPRSRRQPAAIALAIALASWSSGAAALPPGRAWTPITRFHVPGYGSTVAPRLELDAAGRPFLLSVTVYPSDVLAFDWVDSGWVERWRFGQGTITLFPVQSPPGTHYLVWRGVAPVGDERLFFAQVLPDGIQEPDTVASVNLSTEYSATVSAKRRWVGVSDIVAFQYKLRVLYSDTVETWREVPIGRPFGGLDGVALAATGDSSVLIAWCENNRARWATIEGTQWTEGFEFPELGAQRTQLRRRPSGGQWLASGTFSPYLTLRSFREGVWSVPETLRCAHRDGLPNHTAGSPDLSRDEGEYPVIVWDAQNIQALTTICVCVPSDAGYGVAEELEGVTINGGLPTVARDRNGDVWVAWFLWAGDVWWIHSRTRATASRPRLSSSAGHRQVDWTLSEPAPGTWWAVLRARALGAFEEVARVRAGPGLEMSWTDTSPPPGVLRYKIRRESVDIRYLWESAMVRVPEKIRDLSLSLAAPLPIAGRTVLEMDHAAPGAFELSLFDVQGRVVLRQRGFASGTGLDSIAFDVSDARTPVPNGVYFAAVRDASGQVSEALRLVILR